MTKTCTHCGAYFVAKFPNAKLCLTCWQKRERALEQYDALLDEIAMLRDELADRPRHSATQPSPAEYERLLMANLRLHTEVAMLKGELRERSGSSIPADVLRRLIGLCHPDRHANSQAANDATRWLLEQRRSAA